MWRFILPYTISGSSTTAGAASSASGGCRHWITSTRGCVRTSWNTIRSATRSSAPVPAANGCEDDENLLRIRIPFTRKTAQDCLRHLTRMNINPLTLWPAREGACLLANIAMQIEGYHTFW